MTSTLVVWIVTAFAASILPLQDTVGRPLAFDNNWELKGQAIAVVKDGSRDVLQVENGYGYRRDVRLVVQGRQAAVFVNDMSSPAMLGPTWRATRSRDILRSAPSCPRAVPARIPSRASPTSSFAQTSSSSI